MAHVIFCYFDINTGFYPGFHHGIAYLIGALKNNGNKVELIHLRTESELNKVFFKLCNIEYDILGMSFTTNQYRYAKIFTKSLIKKPKLFIAGGVHCSLIKENIFRDLTELDGICIGEGEQAFIELCNLFDKKLDYYKCQSFYFKNNETIIKNSIRRLTKIDEILLPDYSLFDFKKIIAESGDCFPMMLGRGCPYKCAYCCNHVFQSIYPSGNTYVRFPTVEHSLKIVTNNLLLYPHTKKIIFSDDTFTLNKQWLHEFCEAYKSQIGIPYICNARVETISESVANDLKSSGCISVEFGVETGNEWLRKTILNRKHSNVAIIKAFDILHEKKLKCFSFNIMGLPFETKEMARETIKLNQRIQPHFGTCFYFFPFPGSRLHDICREYDLLIDNLESLTGYVKKPAIKGIFMSHGEIKKNVEILRIFFFLQLILSKIRIPNFLKRICLFILVINRKIILKIINPNSGSKILRSIRGIMRKIAYRYLK